MQITHLALYDEKNSQLYKLKNRVNFMNLIKSNWEVDLKTHFKDQEISLAILGLFSDSSN